MEKPAASFRSLPAELRLRILRDTHLGPPDRGGYDDSFECQCRVLPTRLYLVDKQMRREALEVFYSNAYFDLCNGNLGMTLSFLCDILPRNGLSWLRRL